MFIFVSFVCSHSIFVAQLERYGIRIWMFVNIIDRIALKLTASQKSYMNVAFAFIYINQKNVQNVFFSKLYFFIEYRLF